MTDGRMPDGGAASPAGAGATPASFRPRSASVGHEAFGEGDGTVLVEPHVARELRKAAESATQEGRIAGGLLYGRRWNDEQGTYLVISGFLEAGPGENRGDRISRDGRDEFTLSEPDLRLLRRDAGRMYSSSVQVGWWRSLPAAGEFGPRDFQTQYDLVAPGGVGLLVFGSGVSWGAAYLGPDALPPGADELERPAPGPAPETLAGLRSASDFGLYTDGADFRPYPDGDDLEPNPDGEPSADLERSTVLEPSAVIAPEPAPGFDDILGLVDGPDFGGDLNLDDEPDLDDAPLNEPLAPATPVTAVATRRQPVLTPAPQPIGPRVISPVPKPQREWGKGPEASNVGPETPTDVKIVVGLLCLVVVAAAVMIGMLVSNAIVAVVVSVLGLLVIAAFLWFARL